MSTSKRPTRKATFLTSAKEDVGRLADDNPLLATLALRKVKQLEARAIDGAPLGEMAVTGDLGDCRKLYFGLGNPPSHRIVYRELADASGIEIVEVVAIEAREQLYAYLLASSRLGRLPSESKKRFDRLHQSVVQRRTERGRD